MAYTNFLFTNASSTLLTEHSHQYYLLCCRVVSFDLVQLHLVVKGHQGDPIPGSIFDV